MICFFCLNVFEWNNLIPSSLLPSSCQTDGLNQLHDNYHIHFHIHQQSPVSRHSHFHRNTFFLSIQSTITQQIKCFSVDHCLMFPDFRIFDVFCRLASNGECYALGQSVSTLHAEITSQRYPIAISSNVKPLHSVQTFNMWCIQWEMFMLLMIMVSVSVSGDGKLRFSDEINIHFTTKLSAIHSVCYYILIKFGNSTWMDFSLVLGEYRIIRRLVCYKISCLFILVNMILFI